MRWLIFTLALAGCPQEAGDRCNVDTDCDTSAGLICMRPPGGTAQSGGVCQLPGSLPTFDMAVNGDAGEEADLSQATTD